MKIHGLVLNNPPRFYAQPDVSEGYVYVPVEDKQPSPGSAWACFAVAIRLM